MARYELQHREVDGEVIPCQPPQSYPEYSQGQHPVNVHVHVHNHQSQPVSYASGGIIGMVVGAGKIAAFVAIGYFAVMYFKGFSVDESLSIAKEKAPDIQVPTIQGLTMIDGWYIKIKSMITGEEFGTPPILEPVTGYSAVSSPFGFRFHPIKKIMKMHNGVDIPAPNGTPVVAAGAGEVVFAEMAGENGNLVKISHGKGVESVYAHLQDFSVGAGDMVNAGQEIGHVGNTGGSTGNHLHYGVKVNGSFVDPIKYRDSQSIMP